MTRQYTLDHNVNTSDYECYILMCVRKKHICILFLYLYSSRTAVARLIPVQPPCNEPVPLGSKHTFDTWISKRRHHHIRHGSWSDTFTNSWITTWMRPGAFHVSSNVGWRQYFCLQQLFQTLGKNYPSLQRACQNNNKKNRQTMIFAWSKNLKICARAHHYLC